MTSGREELMALALRVEALAGADREVDALIACAVKFTDLRPARPDDFDGKYGYSPGNLKTEHGFLQAERYTASLDYAMSLVPEGWGWVDLEIAPKAAEALLNNQRKQVRGNAATPALAMTAAALRALAEQAQ